jgi:hypothetical protein
MCLQEFVTPLHRACLSHFDYHSITSNLRNPFPSPYYTYIWFALLAILASLAWVFAGAYAVAATAFLAFGAVVRASGSFAACLPLRISALQFTAACS